MGLPAETLPEIVKHLGMDLRMMPLDVFSPRRLFDCAAILGPDIQSWQSSFDPKFLTVEEVGEDGAAIDQMMLPVL